MKKSKSEIKRLAVQSPLGPLEFKAADFAPREGLPQVNLVHIEVAAEIANRLLAERLEKSPVLYGCPSEKGLHWWCGNELTRSPQEEQFTHRARLVCICPITDKKEKK